MKLTLIVAIAIMAAIPVCVQAQNAPAKTKAPSKAEVQRVVASITGDKTKSQKYCELAKLTDQIDAADQKKDTKKVDELSEKADQLVSQIGPDYAAMMDGLQSVDPNSKDGQELGAVIEGLDKMCAK